MDETALRAGAQAGEGEDNHVECISEFVRADLGYIVEVHRGRTGGRGHGKGFRYLSKHSGRMIVSRSNRSSSTASALWPVARFNSLRKARATGSDSKICASDFGDVARR